MEASFKRIRKWQTRPSFKYGWRAVEMLQRAMNRMRYNKRVCAQIHLAVTEMTVKNSQQDYTDPVDAPEYQGTASW